MKGQSAQSDAIAWTMLSWSASGISAICFALTLPTTIRLGRTCRSTRMRRHRALFMPLAALCRRHSSADFTIGMCEFDFRQAHVTAAQVTIAWLLGQDCVIAIPKAVRPHASNQTWTP